MRDLESAAAAIERGGLVVYPTETVYGLGANALESAAVERVFDAKGRDRGKPISFAVSSVGTALEYVRTSEREAAFMREFLPGPVTVLCERRASIPDVLTAGRERVGVRVPDCDVALELCERVETPITATSANRSGRPSALRVDDLDPEIVDAAAVVVSGDEGEDRGSTASTAETADETRSDETTLESTVVDVSSETIHRRGALADEIDRWLAET